VLIERDPTRLNKLKSLQQSELARSHSAEDTIPSIQLISNVRPRNLDQGLLALILPFELCKERDEETIIFLKCIRKE